MTLAHKLLLQTLVGHFALLEATHPRMASTPVARDAKRYARMALRKCESHSRRMAA